jgi:hypothetical protein
MLAKKLLAAVTGAAMLFAASAANAQTRTNDTQTNTTTKKDQNTGQDRPGASGFAPGHTGAKPPGHGGLVPGQQKKMDDKSNSPTKR